MKDANVLTDKPIHHDDIADALIKEFKSLTVTDNSEDHFCMDHKGRGLEIYFTPNDQASNPEFFFEEVLDKIPNRDAYVTSISFTHISIGKRIVALIAERFENTYVDDNDYCWVGSAEEFLKSTHQEQGERDIKELNKKLRKEYFGY